MAATPEKKVKNQCRKVLDELKASHFPPATGGYGKSGVSDIVACIDGLFVAIECKAGKNKPTPLQEAYLDQVRAAGGVALVINERNVELLRDILLASMDAKRASYQI